MIESRNLVVGTWHRFKRYVYCWFVWRGIYSDGHSVLQFAGIRIRLGWAFTKVCGGACTYVVACYSRSSFTFSVPPHPLFILPTSLVYNISFNHTIIKFNLTNDIPKQSLIGGYQLVGVDYRYISFSTIYHSITL